MASRPLRFHPQAEQEYLTALSWYRERSPIAAINFESAFTQAVEKIREAPQRWPIYFSDFRKYTLRQFPFSLVYQEFASEIVVFCGGSRAKAARLLARSYLRGEPGLNGPPVAPPLRMTISDWLSSLANSNYEAAAICPVL